MSTTFQGNTGTSLQAFDPSFGPNTPGRDLSAYMTSVNSIAILTPEHELELAKQYYYDDNVDAARQLVLAHLRFVVHLAKSYSGYGLSQADLIQEGNVGLMKAVKRYNPEVGVRLVSFAVHWIKAEMHEFILRNWRIVKIATTKAQRKLFFNLRSSKKRLGWLSNDEADAVAEDVLDDVSILTLRRDLGQFEPQHRGLPDFGRVEEHLVEAVLGVVVEQQHRTLRAQFKRRSARTTENCKQLKSDFR